MHRLQRKIAILQNIYNSSLSLHSEGVTMSYNTSPSPLAPTECTISPEVVSQIMNEFVEEIKIYSEEQVPSSEVEIERESEKDSPSECNEKEETVNGEETVELTDISPEEYQMQLEEEQRIKDELALIQLTKLTKKRVRQKK